MHYSAQNISAHYGKMRQHKTRDGLVQNSTQRTLLCSGLELGYQNVLEIHIVEYYNR
jgi:hypothetical protein